MTIPKTKITILASISTSLKFQTETSSQNKPPFWPGRKRGYRGCFSPTFVNPTFRYLPAVKYEFENWIFKI